MTVPDANLLPARSETRPRPRTTWPLRMAKTLALGLATTAITFGFQANNTSLQQKLSILGTYANNPKADATAAFQAVLDAGRGGNIVIQAGTYYINATTYLPNDDGVNDFGLRLHSGTTLYLQPGVVLQAIPNTSQHYSILTIGGASKVNVYGPGLVAPDPKTGVISPAQIAILNGEKATHKDQTGQWGFGLTIRSSNNVTVQGIYATNCYGDGFYVFNGNAPASSPSKVGLPPTNITFNGVCADSNRRTGMSIISANGITVKNSQFSNTKGFRTECGMDVEPNEYCQVIGLDIEFCVFTRNNGSGLQLAMRNELINTGVNSVIGSSTIKYNSCTYNGAYPMDTTQTSTNCAGIFLCNTSGHILVNNSCNYNHGHGIKIIGKLGTATCDMLKIYSTGFDKNGTTYLASLSNNDLCGLWMYYCTNSIISNISIQMNSKFQINSKIPLYNAQNKNQAYLNSCTGIQIQNNVIDDFIANTSVPHIMVHGNSLNSFSGNRGTRGNTHAAPLQF